VTDRETGKQEEGKLKCKPRSTRDRYWRAARAAWVTGDCQRSPERCGQNRKEPCQDPRGRPGHDAPAKPGKCGEASQFEGKTQQIIQATYHPHHEPIRVLATRRAGLFVVSVSSDSQPAVADLAANALDNPQPANQVRRVGEDRSTITNQAASMIGMGVRQDHDGQCPPLLKVTVRSWKALPLLDR
jgi:hypothetical protein